MKTKKCTVCNAIRGVGNNGRCSTCNTDIARRAANTRHALKLERLQAAAKARAERRATGSFEAMVKVVLGNLPENARAIIKNHEIIVEIDAENIDVFDIVLNEEAMKDPVKNGIAAIMKKFTGKSTLTPGYNPGI